jgi:hypothetical protein
MAQKVGVGETVFIRTVLAAIALVGFGVLSSACSGDDALTLEEYFQEVGELDDEQAERSAEVEQNLEELGDDASVDEFADLFDDQVASLSKFGADLDNIDPPEEVEDEHEEAVRAINAATEQFDAAIDDFRDADTVDEGFATIDEADTSEIDNATAACRDLEQIALDNNIEADFDCGEDEA